MVTCLETYCQVTYCGIVLVREFADTAIASSIPGTGT